MRYTEIDLQIEDIMWFGVDTNGCIFACTSAGIANVPEFVCKSKEQTEFIEDYFTKELEKTTSAILEAPYVDNPLMRDATGLAEKGVFSFDAVTDNSEYDREYVKIASPKTPIRYAALPDDIKKLLQEHTVPVDAAKEKYICVKHAY
ncbi:hypothetical protein [Ruminococcus albus]|uniref:Uncharacterized protein n=1 Tax=Ruminococcus albus 8 TaxID=246199 RepID=E9SG04_RUMAL|nr:hypothetical protein [Ruminococcus albus]EGC01796.1 hypothetical protein CUS_7725 [Ruminococcus albus 8]MCC3352646.1 hypothetical protein [Ruminococcus albus 8]